MTKPITAVLNCECCAGKYPRAVKRMGSLPRTHVRIKDSDYMCIYCKTHRLFGGNFKNSQKEKKAKKC